MVDPFIPGLLGRPVTIPALDLLRNDVSPSILTITSAKLVPNSKGASLTLGPDGTITYTCPAGVGADCEASKTDMFEYTARNEGGCERTTTASISLEPEPLPYYTLIAVSVCAPDMDGTRVAGPLLHTGAAAGADVAAADGNEAAQGDVTNAAALQAQYGPPAPSSDMPPQCPDEGSQQNKLKQTMAQSVDRKPGVVKRSSKVKQFSCRRGRGGGGRGRRLSQVGIRVRGA